jgi:hypothetical protein
MSVEGDIAKRGKPEEEGALGEVVVAVAAHPREGTTRLPGAWCPSTGEEAHEKDQRGRSAAFGNGERAASELVGSVRERGEGSLGAGLWRSGTAEKHLRGCYGGPCV